MPTVEDLKSSNYLTKEDVEPPIKVTIESYEEVNMAFQGQPPEMKWTLKFKGIDKPLALNLTNGQRIELITGSGDFDEWIGREITLYNDKTIAFGKKITGGIRVWVPQPQIESNPMTTTPNPAMASEPNPEYVGDNPPPPEEDDIPF